MTLIGETFGKYRLTADIGRGGMAQVYLAEHVLIGGQFAVKVLDSRDNEMVKRFYSEARATAAIKHPGIIEIFDFGQHVDGSVYLVMEFLQGETLHGCLSRTRRLPVDRALGIVRQMAAALSVAHRAGVIHRDLKPDNLFLVPDGEVVGGQRVKILDFGIAKLLGAGPVQDRTETRNGMIIGTPDYMSPEQCRGRRDIDHRTDQYSVGCMLFQMLTGQTPFGNVSPDDVFACHVLREPPRPESIEPSIPPVVSGLILRLLAKNRDERFADMDALMQAVEHVSVAPPRRAAPRAPHEQATVWAAQSPAQQSNLTVPLSPVPGSLSPMRGSMVPGRPGSGHIVPVPTATGRIGQVQSGKNPHYTTLSAASAQHWLSTTQGQSMEPPNRALRIMAMGVAAVVAVVLSFIGVQMVRSGDEARPASRNAAAADISDAGVEPDATSTLLPARKVTITLESRPSGAEIYQLPRELRVGKTPESLKLETNEDGEYVFLLRREGYEDKRVVADASRNDRYMVALVPVVVAEIDAGVEEEPEPARTSRKRSSSRTRKRRNQRPTTLDPFQRDSKSKPSVDTNDPLLLDPFKN